MAKKLVWWIFALSCIAIGLYPLVYVFVSQNFGLLSTKNPALLKDLIWNVGFYGHITFGGLALLIGWMQFSKNIRVNYGFLHKRLGKVYLISVLISGLCGFFIGLFATGGIISSLGFLSLDILWLSSSLLAYVAIRKGKYLQHEYLMILSYSACFGAVTLRIWLPLLSHWYGDFITAYRIVAWLSWIPNVFVAMLIIYYKTKKRSTTPSGQTE